ncbi:hypothetical protein ANANG_G00297310 [Anguilla anguilla]|uniref:Uncharacterized protein n=1 Tax=Anguilla anguilla TaxID=7936 RepID=A0A9D3RJQ6_ANGAN|nr:hypothetical protein ANANG_G00297310 [Anguilla anguilla]
MKRRRRRAQTRPPKIRWRARMPWRTRRRAPPPTPGCSLWAPLTRTWPGSATFRSRGQRRRLRRAPPPAPPQPRPSPRPAHAPGRVGAEGLELPVLRHVRALRHAGLLRPAALHHPAEREPRRRQGDGRLHAVGHGGGGDRGPPVRGLCDEPAGRAEDLRAAGVRVAAVRGAGALHRCAGLLGALRLLRALRLPARHRLLHPHPHAGRGRRGGHPQDVVGGGHLRLHPELRVPGGAPAGRYPGGRHTELRLSVLLLCGGDGHRGCVPGTGASGEAVAVLHQKGAPARGREAAEQAAALQTKQEMPVDFLEVDVAMEPSH